MLGGRVAGARRGFPALEGRSKELRILAELVESSDGRGGEMTSFSSGTGVGGLVNTRPCLVFRENTTGVAN
jgi:hypothetical protein